MYGDVLGRILRIGKQGKGVPVHSKLNQLKSLEQDVKKRSVWKGTGAQTNKYYV